MDTDNWIFLTPSQAVNAFAYDFQQYGAQPALFVQLINRFPGMGGDLFLKDGQPFFRVTRDGDPNDLEISGEKMGLFLVHLLESVPLGLATLTSMAGLVFQAAAVSGDWRGTAGIWVEHGMGRFSCAQCGRCCRELAYADACTCEDVDRWQQAGQKKILSRVRQTGDGEFQIWVDPATGELYETCPWLDCSPDDGRCFCTIHRYKPEICRQYPLTSKHAAMTGCRGKFSASGL